MDGVKGQIMSLFKTKDYSKPERVETVYRGGKKQSGKNIIKSLEITEVVLVHCNIVNNYLQNSRVLYTFVPNKSFGQSLDITPKNFIFLKTFDSVVY